MAASDNLVRREVIPWAPSDKGGALGRNLHFDEQSRNYAVSAAPVGKDVLWKRLVKPYDQGQVGCCTIMGLCGILRTQPFRLTTAQKASMSTQAKRLLLYADETAHDEFPGQYPQQDTGSSFLDALKLAVRDGYIDSYEWAFTADQAVASIELGPIGVGVNWHEGCDSPNADGVVSLAGAVRGGHAFEVRGRINTTKYGWVWVCQQSWGPSWPQNPFKDVATFGIVDKDFHQLREENGEVGRPVPKAA